MLDLLDTLADAWRLVLWPTSLSLGAQACGAQQLEKTRDGAHLRCCRLLHGSACLPKRERAPDRDPFDVAV